MARSASSVTLSVVLLSVLLLVVALGLALLGSTALLPQGGAAVLMVLGAMVFLGLQVCVFRLFGLRSRADMVPADDDDADDETGPGGDDDDPDWRAWHG